MYADFNENFDRALPIALNYDHHDEKVQQKLTKNINKYYFKGQSKLTRDTHQNLTNVNISQKQQQQMDKAHTQKTIQHFCVCITMLYPLVTSNRLYEIRPHTIMML